MRVKLLLAGKQLSAARTARVDTFVMVIPKLAGEGALRAGLAKYVELLRVQLLAPLFFSLDNFWGHNRSNALGRHLIPEDARWRHALQAE
jgi:hypothetical protein